jgi:glycogen(starch) synthase
LFALKWGVNVATVLTLHSTTLGRRLSSEGYGFFEHLETYNYDAEASRRGILTIHKLQRRACQLAHVVTAVSEITAREIRAVLGRRVDLITPLGLPIGRSKVLHQFEQQHEARKNKIHEFVLGHFSGQLDFDLLNTLYFYFGGRYEYRNMGINVFIDALSRLNERLKASGSKLTIVAFIVVPAPTRNLNEHTLYGQAS